MTMQGMPQHPPSADHIYRGTFKLTDMANPSMSSTADPITIPYDAVSSIGETIDHVNVQIGPQFLNLFSEHLYSSPNKAFEELISNSWDAGATRVEIDIPDDLAIPSASIWILDNGESMDVTGFRALWSVATSQKRIIPNASGRKPIGKFGVGKLATYLLANELTYACKASDGVIRMITMDYRRIDDQAKGALHIEPLPLNVRQLNDAQFRELLSSIDQGSLVESFLTKVDDEDPADPSFDDEFGGPQFKAVPSNGTWTLAILSSLKPAGQNLQRGQIRRILRAALPLGETIAITLNEEKLSSAKNNKDVQQEWILGPGLGIATLTLPDGSKVEINEVNKPYPHLFVDGVGEVSGRARLFDSKISGGKSDDIEVSNGFFINVLGRVIKPEDPYFGLDNLSHSAWSKFRLTLRADGLDKALSVNREGLSHSRELQIIKTLIMRVFNKARQVHDQKIGESWPDAGAILTEKWGSIPFEPLQRVVLDSFSSRSEAPDFIDLDRVEELEKARETWAESIALQPGNLIRDVIVSDLGSENRLVRYQPVDRTVVVNRNHPFAEEHSGTSEELRVLRDLALVDLLTDAFMVDLGIGEYRLKEIRDYKDRALRLVAQVRRQSAGQIANLLNNVTNHAKGLERIVGDALEYLGFQVERLGQSGEPEGVATAVISPMAGEEGVVLVAYRFTYDAKSSAGSKSKTSNINAAGLSRHREDKSADYTLVVAPGFEQGALEHEARANGLTPMKASDLARLVMATVGFGPFNLVEFRGIFANYTPSSVSSWIDGAIAGRKQAKLLSLDTLITALISVTKKNPNGPDMLHCSQIAEQCRTILGDKLFPTRGDVAVAINGLSLMVPNVITISLQSQDVFLNASPEALRTALVQQLNMLPDDLKFGIVREKDA
jgi:hypothetical protein